MLLAQDCFILTMVSKEVTNIETNIKILVS